MKYVPLLLLLIISSCRKAVDVRDPHETLKQNSLAYLHNHYPEVLAQIDVTHMYVSEQPEPFVRFGFHGKNIGEEMILLKTNKTGQVEGGKMIRLYLTDTVQLNGHIQVYALDHSLIIEAAIVHGDVVRPKSPYPASAIVIEEEQTSSPMLAKRYATEGVDRPFTIVEYINVSRAYNNLAQATSSSGYYSQRYPEQKNDYGGSGTTSPPYTILIDQESTAGKTALNIKQMIDCFYTVPDGGATCTMELLADIPADDDPYALFDWMSGSPGHCFIKLTKKAGVKVMTSHIGFYPETPFKSTATTAPINGKFFDNGKHEYNASMRMSITTAQLDQILSFLQKRSLAPKYDIDDYNCSNFAVEVFNLARPTNPLVPPRVRIPESITPSGSITPQSVYLELQRLKKVSAAERGNITLPTAKAHTGSSVSPCK